MNATRTAVASLLIAASLTAGAAAQVAADRTFTYQGRLLNDGAPMNGPVLVHWSIFGQAVGGNPLGNGDVNVTAVDGLIQFDVPLASIARTQFLGSERYLELEIRPEGGPAQVLSPRQILRPAPYSIYALNNAFNFDGVSLATFNVPNGKVGIGNSNPSFPLTVTAAPGAGGQPLLQFRNTNNNARWHFGLSPTDGFNLAQTSIADYRLFVSTQGLVGINTGTPDSALQVFGSSTSTSQIKVSYNANYDLTLNALGDVFMRGSDMVLKTNSGDQVVVRTAVGGDTARFVVEGRTYTNTLQINGGSDIAEPYDIAAAAGVQPAPGMVVAIDPAAIGKLRIATSAYDHAVAGIISGAGGVKPGMTLTQPGTDADGKVPVANVGRVWCYVDADANGPVVAGDLLTTSATPGHAMKADPARANGAILGKAMSNLDRGKGLVLVLVGLQ